MSEKTLPGYLHPRANGQPKRSTRIFGLFAGAALLSLGSLVSFTLSNNAEHRTTRIPLHAEETVLKCRQLLLPPGPPADFASRTISDRFVDGTKPVHIKNATIWTGGVDGHEVITGDILLDRGLIQGVGQLELSSYSELVEYDAQGAWVTPGLFDLHSHVGVYSLPRLDGAADGNSHNGNVQPWLRSLDGLNTHDTAFEAIIAGGITTGVVLPGSANSVGGQAFVVKYRPTAEKTPSAMLLEPPHSIVNGSYVDPTLPPRWRQMKHACGENPRRVYSQTRMDNIWDLREGYNKARVLKEKQDTYCASALAGEWEGLGEYPDDLQWEAFVDVLRGRVKIHNHCYEAVDLDNMVRLTNEFKFPIAAFHHAHETYLVPDALKRAYGGPPAAAIFATNGRYKREAYRGSEFAPKILADNGIQVVMKSDHPVLNSRYLAFEAQQAHYYGLPANLALASVITTPAKIAGMDHRVAAVKPGYDADVVVWDSHPLALGATPKQVWIDGIPQFETPHSVIKPASSQKSPETPNFEQEAKDAVQYDGLPPLKAATSNSGAVVFTNVSEMIIKKESNIITTFEDAGNNVVIVENGHITCSGSCAIAFSEEYANATFMDLQGGSISPGLTTFGSPLGLQHITQESSTGDGPAPNHLAGKVPGLLGPLPLVAAVDGLLYESRDMLLAYRHGVTTGISAPGGRGLVSGFSVAFSTGAGHKLEDGAVIQNSVAIHVTLSLDSSTSVSTQVAALRHLLLEEAAFEDVRKGLQTIVIHVDSADILATLILLKREVEGKTGTAIKLTVAGAAEAHLLAAELGEAGVGVILMPARSFPVKWEQQRVVLGPPLTAETPIGILRAHNVTVAIGVEEQWGARNTRFEVGWAALSASTELSRTEAIALASTELEELLGLTSPSSDLVVTQKGGLLDFESKVVAIISPTKGVVESF
ncbi:composite domain of metallo-dependent hydrolase [Cylindrobasidium torrendii FP15055 ss-10]|uniref:Composite domain of metallo-dependent hydrolase n=1 Tax=Cylindrobasidium torrendii FP15055 ss-10 TaxID=1314674 RepID=A0A0D7BAE1_9AGAR|nr:composite domain of metallo-dependent hydrolase [Cylindrobasidium torrendii FP15055 ss-10]